MRTMYRITLLPDHNALCQELAIVAAKSNGNKVKTSPEALESYFAIEQMRYPYANADMTFEIINNNLIHVDRKVNDSYETVLILEQVAILELANNGILDEQQQELLN